MHQPRSSLTHSILTRAGLAIAMCVGTSMCIAQPAHAAQPANTRSAHSQPGQPAQTQPDAAFQWSLEAFQAAAAYSEKNSGRAMLVMRDGQVLFEQYANGGGATRPHPLASGSKSFTGIMAMMAVQDGLLTLDELASDTLTEWKSDPKKSKITIRHLLTLSSGLDPADKLLGGRGGGRLLGDGARRRSERLGEDPKPQNHFQAVLTIPAKHDPGEIFDYGPSHFYAFGALLQRKLEKSDLPQTTTMEYLQERVFKDLNIENPLVGKDAADCPNLPGGILLTALQWVKFGQFVLDHGSVRQADGTMIEKLKPELLAQCFESSKNNAPYGLTWWLNVNAESTLLDARIADGGGAAAGAAPADDAAQGNDADARAKLRARIRERLIEARREREAQRLATPNGNGIRVYMAAGLGKQRLYVLPDQNLVIVRFAEATDQGRRYSDAEFLALALGKLPTSDTNADTPAEPSKSE